MLQRELDAVKKDKDAFIKEFSEVRSLFIHNLFPLFLILIFFHGSYYAYRVIRMTTVKLSMVGRRSLREVQLVSRGGDCLLPRNDESIILKLSMVGRRNSREVQLVSRGWDCLLPRNDESIVS